MVQTSTMCGAWAESAQWHNGHSGGVLGSRSPATKYWIFWMHHIPPPLAGDFANRLDFIRADPPTVIIAEELHIYWLDIFPCSGSGGIMSKSASSCSWHEDILGPYSDSIPPNLLRCGAICSMASMQLIEQIWHSKSCCLQRTKHCTASQCGCWWWCCPFSRIWKIISLLTCFAYFLLTTIPKQSLSII